jgi:membrane associated rhomboid family serine protease
VENSWVPWVLTGFVWALCVPFILLLRRSSRYWVRRAARGGVRLTEVSRHGVLAGSLAAVLGLLCGLPSGAAASAVASITGALFGLWVGRRLAGKRQQQLSLRGQLAPDPAVPRTLSRAGRLGWFAALIFFLASALLGALAKPPPLSFCLRLISVMLGASGTTVLSASLYAWLWAKRKERQGFSPLVIPPADAQR